MITPLSSYASGSVVGGVQAFPNCFRGVGVYQNKGSGVLQDVTLVSTSAQTASFSVWLFNASPSLSTLNNFALPVLNSADAPKLITGAPILLGTGSNGLGGTVTSWGADALGRAVYSPSGTLYVVMTVSGTPTFATSSDLTLTLSFLQD